VGRLREKHYTGGAVREPPEQRTALLEDQQ
jgi:hypothetical protein